MRQNIYITHLTDTFVHKILTQGIKIPSRKGNLTTGQKFVIINGDDLCRDEATNRFIIQAFTTGILTSTSAFINLKDSEKQLSKIHKAHPNLPIGLHLNLTNGFPVSDKHTVKNIIDVNGAFYDIHNILYHLPEMPVREVRQELFAQFEKFQSTGVPIDHINYHFHLAALYTPFFDIVRELALKYNVPVRNPVPISIYNSIHLNNNGGGSHEGIKKLIRFGMVQPFKMLSLIKKVKPAALIEQEKIMFTEGIRSSDWFVDSLYGNATVKNFISILEQLPEGITEIMCHPAIEAELEVLLNNEVKNKIEALGIKLISWSNLNQPE